jgi:hypothetical protein
MKRRKLSQAHLRDLFGEIPVTWPEVDAWCLAVAGLTPESPRRAHYIEAWRVLDKIRQAKVTGTLDAILSKLESTPSSPGRSTAL